MIHGLFHGDLHGGNLFVMRDGRTALLDFGIVARLPEARRIACGPKRAPGRLETALSNGTPQITASTPARSRE